MNCAKYIHNCTQGVDAWYNVNNFKTKTTYSTKSNNMYDFNYHFEIL